MRDIVSSDETTGACVKSGYNVLKLKAEVCL
jgi:hypothetical protein